MQIVLKDLGREEGMGENGSGNTGIQTAHSTASVVTHLAHCAGHLASAKCIFLKAIYDIFVNNI